jgi:Putative zinc-finger
MKMNRCSQYSDWLTDAALGELASGSEAELLAHAANCDACREAYNHARELSAFTDQIDRGVELLVAGEPSPHFNSRLRARLAEEASAPRFNWFAWAPVAAGTIALGVVLVVFALWTHHAVPATPVSSEVAVNTTAASANTNSPHAFGFAKGAGSPAANPSATIVHHRSHLHASPASSEVVVPPGQLAAAIQFADAVHAGRIDGAKLVAAEQQLNAPLEIKPIEIAPLSPSSSDVPEGTPLNQTPLN